MELAENCCSCCKAAKEERKEGRLRGDEGFEGGVVADKNGDFDCTSVIFSVVWSLGEASIIESTSRLCLSEREQLGELELEGEERQRLQPPQCNEQ